VNSDSSRPIIRRNRRRVIDEHGVCHPSITAAAEAHGLSMSYAYAKARLSRGGWRFADEVPWQPAAPSSTSEG
jgi:hypothetical protein